MPFVPGQSFYFVARTRHLAPVFAAPAAVQRLRTSMRRARQRYPFSIDAVAVRPDSVMTLWILPGAQQDYIGRWRYIRANFSRWYGSEVAAVQPGVKRSPWQAKLHAIKVADADEYEELLAHVRRESFGGLL